MNFASFTMPLHHFFGNPFFAALSLIFYFCLLFICRIVTERETGKPRGFGFVEFYDIPTAESCIRNLNGADLNGRTIRIVFAEGGPADFRPRGKKEGKTQEKTLRCTAKYSIRFNYPLFLLRQGTKKATLILLFNYFPTPNCR